MDGLRAALAAGFHDCLNNLITLGGRRGADRHGLVGHHDVKRVSIRLRVHGNGFDAHPAGRSDNPAGDLAAIGDQNSFEHAWRPATFGRGPIFSTAYAVRPTTLSCFLVQKNQTAAKTFQRERTSRSLDMSPFPLHVAPAQETFSADRL